MQKNIVMIFLAMEAMILDRVEYYRGYHRIGQDKFHDGG